MQGTPFARIINKVMKTINVRSIHPKTMCMCLKIHEDVMLL